MAVNDRFYCTFNFYKFLASCYCVRISIKINVRSFKIIQSIKDTDMWHISLFDYHITSDFQLLFSWFTWDFILVFTSVDALVNRTLLKITVCRLDHHLCTASVNVIFWPPQHWYSLPFYLMQYLNNYSSVLFSVPSLRSVQWTYWWSGWCMHFYT